MKKVLLLPALCIALITCKKENDRPQWDIEVKGPLFRATLGTDHLLADSLLQVLPDSSVRLIFEKDLEAISADSIYSLPDTTIPSSYVWNLFPITVGPGQTFPTQNNRITLGLGDVQLKWIEIESGSIRLDFKNTLGTRVYFTYTIPDVKKNGNSFAVTRLVNAGSNAAPTLYSETFDVSGYSAALTGVSGLLFNSIYYNTQMVSDTFGPSITLFAGDTILNLKTTLISLKPSYASGYLSSQSMDQQGSEYIGIGENIRSGTILLDSVKMTMDVKNYIGADERVNFTQIRSVNDGSGSTVDLTAPGFINHTTNINRALETGPYPSPVIPSTYSVTLDRSNSNIREILENLPDRIEYNLNMDLNPLGNVSGYSDFIYTHQLIEAKMRFEMPLRFAASQLVISDTLDINSTSFTNLDPVGPSDMTLWAENGFPFDLDLKIFLQDHSGSITDSLPVTGMIQQGLINPVTLKVVSPKTTVLPFRVDESRKQKIMNASGLLIRATMHTPFFPSPIQIFSDYKLDLRLVAEGIYTIR